MVLYASALWSGMEGERDRDRERRRDRERESEREMNVVGVYSTLWSGGVQGMGGQNIALFATIGTLTDSRGQKTSRRIFSILTQCLSHSFALPDLLLCVKI